MKTNRAIYRFLFAVLLLPLFLNCKKHSIPIDTPPVVTTNDVTTDAGAWYVIMRGEVISEGGSPVTEKGVCVSTHQTPTLTDDRYPFGFGTGVIAVQVAVSVGITYYVRAYAINAVGTTYGNQVIVTVPAYPLFLPTITTNIAITVNSTSALVGGYLHSDYGAEGTVRGICWSATHNHPTIKNNITSDGTGVGFFIHTISGLSPNTNYYFRAYATNSTGTAYGEDIAFVLDKFNDPTVTDIDGNVYHTVTIGTQVWMVENLRTTKFRNGDPIPNNTVDLGTPNGLHGYSDYNHDPNYSTVYGRLYDWYVVTDPRNIAPEGWHVPGETEWTTLTDYLTNNGYGYEGSGDDIAKSMASKSGWLSSDSVGTVGYNQFTNNKSGFTALPGGGRIYEEGHMYQPKGFYFEGIGMGGHWWGSTLPITGKGGSRSIYYFYKVPAIIIPLPDEGYSVRCVKD